MPHLLRSPLATAMLALVFHACSDDSSTAPQQPQPPALEGTWRYPKAGGSNDGLFRFTMKLGGGDTVRYQGYLDGTKIDSVAGTWTIKGDTIVASLSDTIDFSFLVTRPDSGDALSTTGGSPSNLIRTLKFLRSGSDLRDPIHNIELGKE